MTVHNIFGSYVGGTDDSNGGTAINVGTAVHFGDGGECVGVRFYCHASPTGTFTAQLWQETTQGAGMTLLASKEASSPTGSAWNEVLFDTPVSVDSAGNYVVSIFSSAGLFHGENGYFGSASVIQIGDENTVAAWGDNVDISSFVTGFTNPQHNGLYRDDGTSGYPSNTFGSSFYHVDAMWDDLLDASLGTPVLSFVSKSNPTTPAGTDGSITVSWPAVDGADHYEAGIAPGPDANQGDIGLVDADVTSPHTFAGLSAGSYTVGIRAMPAA